MTDEPKKKLSLKKPEPTAATHSPEGDAPRRKPPVRGAGTAPRKRLSAAEAAQAREEAAAREAAWRAAAQDAPKPSSRQEDAARGPARGPRRDGPAAASPGPARKTPARGGGHPSGAERARPHADEKRGEQRSDRHSDRRTEGRPTGSGFASAQPPAPTRVPAQPPAAPREDDGRVRLSKLMSEQGLASRREADEWIEHGWVRVDGEVVSELGSRIFPDQVITIDPAARSQQAQRVTILIHKPIGYVSGQAEDGYEPAVTLIKPENRWKEDRLPIQLTRGHLRNLAPAGRLDIDSTGLLVLTQDGRIAKQLIGEDSGIEKEYLVRVESMSEPEAENLSAIVPPEALDALRFGLELDGRPLKPAQVSWQNEQQLRFVLREGRKRQIRRMCELVGLKVVGLKRVRMGRITLSKLPVGQWRFLRPDERF